MNNYKSGFENLTNEVSNKPLSIQGVVPEWLDGTLLRTGPAQFDVGENKLNHWFDGFAMLHSFTFNNGTISYSNKFLESNSYHVAKKSGAIHYREFATDPCRAIFKKFFTLFSPNLTDNGNVNITRIMDEYLALTETPLPVMFDRKFLTTKGHFKFDDDLAGQITTAHPQYDSETQESFNYLVNISLKNHYLVYRIPHNSKSRKLLAKIPAEKPSYMHSFALTKHYVILVEWPLVVNPLDLAFSNQPFIGNYQWHPERKLTFILINRTDGTVTKQTSNETYFAFHHINAFEKDSEIILDIATYDDPSLIHALYLDQLRAEEPLIPRSELRRFTLNIDTNTVTSEKLVDEPIELPRINYKHNGCKYQFAYGASYNKDGDFLNQLVKVDVQNKTTKTWCEENLYPGEPVFIQKPNATGEDDGIILSVALDVTQEKSILLVLNAKDFTEIGRALLPHHAPFGFHGNFYK